MSFPVSTISRSEFSPALGGKARPRQSGSGDPHAHKAILECAVAPRTQAELVSEKADDFTHAYLYRGFRLVLRVCEQKEWMKGAKWGRDKGEWVKGQKPALWSLSPVAAAC